jgi:hypothetical protein
MQEYRFLPAQVMFSTHFAVSCLTLFLLFCSCPASAGSNQVNHLDQNRPEARYVSADTTTSTPEILQIYKTIFQRAYQIAPDIRKARTEKSQKSAQRYTAWAKRLAPSVSARLAQVHDFNPDDDSDTPEDPESPQPYNYVDGEDYQDWRFILSLPVYQRSVSVAVDIARADEQLAENTLRIRTNELDLRARELLGDYLIASYRLLNLDNSILLSEKHVARIRRGYELRDQTRLQLLRAEANLKELEAGATWTGTAAKQLYENFLNSQGLNRASRFWPNFSVSCMTKQPVPGRSTPWPICNRHTKESDHLSKSRIR